MGMKIAVLCQDKKTLCELTDMDTVIVFEHQENGSWQQRKRFPFRLRSTASMDELRNDIRNLITKLDDCRIIAGRAINGLAYNVFDRMGFHIFSIEAAESATFDQIRHDIESLSAEPAPAEDIAKTPQCVGDGIYYLDLIELQQHFPEMSSKQALQPFFQKTCFQKLDLLCSHLPLWLNSPEYGEKFSIRTKKYGQNVLASVQQKNSRSRQK